MRHAFDLVTLFRRIAMENGENAADLRRPVRERVHLRFRQRRAWIEFACITGIVMVLRFQAGDLPALSLAGVFDIVFSVIFLCAIWVAIEVLLLWISALAPDRNRE